MPDQHIATYLHDHHAGSVAAVELLEHLEAAHAGTDLARFAARLREDIAADQKELESLMGRLGLSAGGLRSAVAWAAEKAARLQLRLDDKEGGDLRLPEA